MTETRYSNAQVCLNGHVITAYGDFPGRGSNFCPTCGEKTIRHCTDVEKCNAPIRGKLSVDMAAVIEDLQSPPNYCHNCGKPYPWAERRAEALAEAIDELDELQTEDRDKLKQSIPDVLRETPKTETAVVRFKKAMVAAGKLGGKMLQDVLVKVAAEVVVQQMKHQN